MLRFLSAVGLALTLVATAAAKEKTARDEDAPPAAPAAAGDGAYFAPAEESTSASLAYHAQTGLQAAFVGFGEDNNDLLYYAQCTGEDCTDDASWQRVALPLPEAVKAQLALTPEGQPRILGAGWSATQANGTNYFFAQCDRDCLEADNWQIGRIVSTADGLMSNISRTRLPERTFALDDAGHPRFVVTDSNYHIEPDHYGAFFMACEVDCTEAANWSETNLANQVGYNTEAFSYPVLALGPNGAAHVLAGVYAFDENGTDLEDGLYYYQCETDCAARDNWQRTRIMAQGSGSYPNPTWSMTLSSTGLPRAALFTGYGVDIEGLDRQLLYIFCDADCTKAAGENWFGYPLGVGDGVGESPDIRLDSGDIPHIAFTTDHFELGYAVCTADCENPDKAAWSADLAEPSARAAADRPTALPFTCDGEVWNGMAPSLALLADRPMVAYDLSVEARCLYKEYDKPEITYEFHEIWRGSRVLRPAQS